MSDFGEGAMMWEMALTVLIVDDHDGFRASARGLLEAEGFVVVGEAASGLGAVAESDRLRPDVVLLDVQLPDIDGFDVARRLAQAAHAPAVVFISSRDAVDYGDLLAGVPARGFLTKRELNGVALAELLG